MRMSKTVLNLAPHPDDELIGAPAALFALRDAGWRVVNFTCSLGRSDIAERRRREMIDACSRAGFEPLVAASPLADPLRAADLPDAQASLTAEIARLHEDIAPDLILAPSPHDRHRGHEVVGRAVIDVLERAGSGRLWMWGLWADLPFPTLLTPFGEARLGEILVALSAHAGEIDRNDYRHLVAGRAEMNASIGPERVFGFGVESPPHPRVEVISEAGLVDERWFLGQPAWLDPASVPGALGTREITAWLRSPSLTDAYGLPGEDS